MPLSMPSTPFRNPSAARGLAGMRRCITATLRSRLGDNCSMWNGVLITAYLLDGKGEKKQKSTTGWKSCPIRVSRSYLDNGGNRSEEHTSELQSHSDLVCRLLLEK